MPTDQMLVMALHHFVLDREHSASIAHIPKNKNTERPLNTWKYSNNKDIQWDTDSTSEKERESQSPK